MLGDSRVANLARMAELDVRDSPQDYRAGDVIRLQLGYFSTMRAFTSDYVEQVYLDA